MAKIKDQDLMSPIGLANAMIMVTWRASVVVVRAIISLRAGRTARRLADQRAREIGKRRR